MKRNFYFLLCALLVFCFSFSAKAQFPPSFTGGHSQSLSVCKNSSPNAINSLLAVIDFDAGQTETWSVSIGALHGTLLASYTGTSTGGVITPVGLSYTPNFGYTGVDSFRVMISDGTSSDLTTIHVAVNAIPTAITGPTSVCVGSVITLNDGTTGGGWSTSAPGVASVTTIGSGASYVGGVSAGTATISYTIPDGCSALSVITVNPIPATITGATSVCAGLTTPLADATGGGTWASSATGVATVDAGTGEMTGVSAGFATITYTLSTGCKIVRSATVNAAPGALTGSGIVCVGSTTTLSDAVPSGFWSSSDVSVASVTSGVVTGISTGTVTITYTLGSGCTATKIMTVNNSPAAITGPSSVCQGFTITLSDVVGGGTWSSTSPMVSVNPSTGDVTGVTGGVPTILYTVGGCSASKIITVNPISPITGNHAICPYTTLTLNDATGGGNWSSSSVLIATVTTVSSVGFGVGIVTGVSGGVTTISYTMPSGCTVVTDVTINPAPADIIGTISICSGLSASLFDPSGGGVWTSNNTSVATINLTTGIYNAISGGTAIISYTLPSTGCFATRELTVHATPAAVTGPGIVCGGSAITLSDASTGGVWSSGDISIATVNSSTGVVTGATAGLVNITYTLGGACIAVKPITVNLTGAPISGPSSVCRGFSITLSDVTGGGVWSSSSPFVSVVPATGVVTGVTGGVATITYSIGSCIATKLVTVNIISPITLNAPICVGATLTLNDATGGGNWTSSNVIIATVSTVSSVGFGVGIVSGVTAGSATISYTMPTGCVVTTIVTINPLPLPITGIAAVCAGSTTALADATGGGYWTSHSPAVATISTAGVASGVSAGTSIITYTLSSTGCLITRILTVNPQPSAITGTGVVCNHSSVTFSESAIGGTWTSSNDTTATVVSSAPTAGLVTGNTAGVATITYTLPGGCIATKDITVNVTPLPIVGSSNMCNGFTETLVDSTNGGVWSNTGLSITIGSSTGFVTAIAAGVSNVTYTIGSCIATKSMTVNAIAPISGPTGVCKGATITLRDDVGGGYWASADPTVATVTTVSSIGFGVGSVTGVSTGTTTISYIMPSGCIVISVITVNPLPVAITGNLVFCQGSTTTLSDASAGGTWSNTDPTIATVVVGTGTVSGVSGGTSIITYKLPTGCISFKVVTVNPLPVGIVGDTNLCFGILATIHSAGSGHWFSTDPSIASVDSITGFDYGVAIGATTFSYTLSTGCSFVTNITVRDCHVGVKQITPGAGDISVIPNPNKGAFTIRGSLATANDDEVFIEITDMLGRTIYKDKTNAVGGKINKQVNLTGGLANGSYILNLRSGTENRTFHIVIQQ